jgi:prepilin-type N-terminal cleavage/methylation domain-containing protein
MIARRRGFTLIEILIAVSIIILLAAVLIVSFSGAFSKSRQAQTTTTIETLKSNIETFKSRWGIPPPANLNELGALVGYPAVADPNKSNIGIESLVLALRSRREQGPYLDPGLLQDDTRRLNLDVDSALEAALGQNYIDIDPAESRELFEIADAWGNPLVYIDMKTVQRGNFELEITQADGTTARLDATECQNALRHPTTGALPTEYVIWSFGEDGINQYGLGDDVTSWPKYE